jgi:NAD-dependent DNA ligase
MIKELVQDLEIYNKEYRLGNPIMSDSEYDTLIEELTLLDPDNEILKLVGHKIIDVDRKRKLEHDMASMNKIKTIDEFKKWIRLKGISPKSEVVCTPKYDGLSLLVNEKNDSATTRGDGTYGQDSDEHYKLINNKLNKNQNIFTHTYGEVIMKKETFLNKYSEDFANPRNLVAGLINSKEVSEPLCDVDYIKYGGVYKNYVFFKKSTILEELNKNQEIKVEYETFIIEELTEEILIDLFKKWSIQYEIDGIIIEIDDIIIQQQLGRDKSTNNPQYAVAFKHECFEQKADTEVLGISWNISKQGLLKPIIHLNPIKLDGVTISTSNNSNN